MSCDPQTLAAAAKCFDCIPNEMQAAVQSYLLASIAGGSMDPATLMKEARCITSCLPPSVLPEAKTYLLCEIVDNLPSPEPPAPECDADAQAFITAAGLDPDSNEAAAICVLVRDLKTYPAAAPSGSKYWDRDYVIYPFVGGTAASHSFNLLNPLLYQITYVATVTHSALGIKGDGVLGYANTHFNLPAGTQDSIMSMIYLQTLSTIDGRYYFGCSNGPQTAKLALGHVSGTVAFRYRVNCGVNTDINNSLSLGAKFIERYDPANKRYAFSAAAWGATLTPSTGLANATPIALLAIFNALPNPSAPSNATISSFSVGQPLDSGGGNTEHLEYKAIWDNFNNILSRAHP